MLFLRTWISFLGILIWVIDVPDVPLIKLQDRLIYYWRLPVAHPCQRAAESMVVEKKATGDRQRHCDIVNRYHYKNMYPTTGYAFKSGTIWNFHAFTGIQLQFPQTLVKTQERLIQIGRIFKSQGVQPSMVQSEKWRSRGSPNTVPANSSWNPAETHPEWANFLLAIITMIETWRLV